MKKTSILLGMGLSAVALSLTLLPAGLAAQQAGDSLVILLPAGKLQNPSLVVVVTGKHKRATKVGTCKAGEFHPQDANIVDREEQKAPTTAEVIVIDLGYRNEPSRFDGIELAAGTRLGSFRGGGDCGPGYNVYTAHVLAQ